MVNFFARKAVREGADWLFFLDADEFLLVEGRSDLETILNGYGGDVVSMPWLNLIPETFGEFSLFAVEQRFFWRGRVSRFAKIAASTLYFHAHPDAYIEEGNHRIRSSIDGPLAEERFGLPLLHLPVRSHERLLYKLTNSLRFLSSKHNTKEGEGSHVFSILEAIKGERTSKAYLNAIAAHYGENDEPLEALDPEALDFPVMELPRYLTTARKEPPRTLTLGLTLAADAKVRWRDSDFVKGSPVTAALAGDELRIVAQPISGRLEPRYGPFEVLPPVGEAALSRLVPGGAPRLGAEALAASLLPIRFATFSAWSQLIPALFALFAVVRPRRYVELGVHNGMSFFAACQVSEHLQSKTECIAVDSWVGDPHASFHSSEVFEEFKSNLTTNYPDAFFVQGMFSQAVDCFEDGSIDVLHIDGYHTYDAVKSDFDGWIGKMSDIGIVLMHDINVHERNFGVWQFWEELCSRYVGLSFMHSHGLGVLYVGSQDHALAAGFRWLNDNPSYFGILQKYFEALGERSVDHKVKIDELKMCTKNIEAKDCEIKELTARVLSLESAQDRIVVPVRQEFGSTADHLAMVTLALKRFTRALRVRRALLWPLKASRRRYRRKLKLVLELRRSVKVVPTDT